MEERTNDEGYSPLEEITEAMSTQQVLIGSASLINQVYRFDYGDTGLSCRRIAAPIRRSESARSTLVGQCARLAFTNRQGVL